MENLYEFKKRKEGARDLLQVLNNQIDIIENFESNVSRRYKLLKFIIENSYENIEYILNKYKYPEFSYRFEKGEIKIGI